MNGNHHNQPRTLLEREHTRSTEETLRGQLEMMEERGYFTPGYARAYERTIRDADDQVLETLTPGNSWPPDPDEAIAAIEYLQSKPEYRDCELHYGFRSEDDSRYSFTWACARVPNVEPGDDHDRDNSGKMLYSSGLGQDVAQVTVADIVEQPTLLLPTVRLEDDHTFAADWTMLFENAGGRPVFGRAVRELDEPTSTCIAECLQTLWCRAIAYQHAHLPDSEMFLVMTLHRHRRGASLPELREVDETFPGLGTQLVYLSIEPTAAEVDRGHFRMRTTIGRSPHLLDSARSMAATLPMMATGIFRFAEELAAGTEEPRNV